jgi:diguanylate cyclase (GGDEF)-like protein/PAS domain S-box-containing protein
MCGAGSFNNMPDDGRTEFKHMTKDFPVDAALGQSKTSRTLAFLCGLLVCLLAISVLIGWALPSIVLTRIHAGWPAMAPVTALEFALGGGALCGLSGFARCSKPQAAVICGAGIIVALGGLLKLIEDSLSLHGLSDSLWFASAASGGPAAQAQMSPFTALSFVLLGTCIALAAAGTRRLGLFQGLALAAGLLGWLGLSRYLYGEAPLPPGVPYAQMALHTAAGIALLAFGVLCTRMDGGLTGLIIADSDGGMLARRLLPPALVVPLAIGWVWLKAKQLGCLATDERHSLLALWNVLAFGTLVWITAHLVHRSDLRRRQAEGATERHLEHLAAVIQNEPECVKLVGPDGSLLEMNPAGLAMLEVPSLREAQQHRLADYLLPQYRASFGSLHQKVMGGGSGTVEFEIQGRRGTRRWMETHAAPLRDSNGQVVALLGIARDISARKRAEKIQEQVQLFRDLLDRSHDLIYVADAASGRFLDCNAALPRRLGFTREEILERHVWDVSAAAGGPADWPDRLRQIQQAGAGIVETLYRCRDGSTVPVEVNLSYVSAAARADIIAVSRDVTERHRQQERILHLSRILKMQSAVSAVILRVEDREQMLQEACRVAADIGGYEQVVLSVADDTGSEARVAYRARRWAIPEPPPMKIAIGDDTEPDTTASGRALRAGQVVFRDIERTGPDMFGRDELLRAGIRSLIALPVTVDGARFGALTLFSSRPGPIQDEELILLQDITATLGYALQSQRHANVAQFLTYYDSLTGLAKRSLFCERLNAFLERSVVHLENPIVAALDVHALSGVNDTYGRSFGDALLQKTAERLRWAAEAEDQIGYLGSGTFVVAVREHAGTAEGVMATMDRAVFESPFEVQGRRFRISCRSGLARYPDDGQDAATLVEHAEAALRQAKESGEKYLHFKLQMHSEVTERLQLEHRLQEALHEQQFVLHYQPQVGIATGRIEAVEALLRWQDPEHGLTPPAQFLSVLEASGMIDEVGAWALRQAVHDCARWQRLGFGPLRVAVNVSSLQIRRRRFVEEILQAVDSASPAKVGLDLEITETSLLQDLDDARRKLHHLRSAGIRIAIDDFGTGYSSLGLLPTVPVDILKIDRSFIQGLPRDRASVALTASIVQIATAFDLSTVAEGVESAEQLEMLRTFGCSQSQGFLHARPMPAKELEFRWKAGTLAIRG